MRSIIFSNYSAYETQRLSATMDVEHSHLRFLGNMTLNLWDCGGQDVFVENYFSSQRDHIFGGVEVHIHVFDVQSNEVQKDIRTFIECLSHLRKFSPKARIFVLIHKMDLVKPEKRPEIFDTFMLYLRDQSKPYGFEITGFMTSIWDESLYKAWSQIVCSMVPNMSMFQRYLQRFAEISEAEEVVLFERTTFLVISHVSPLAERQASYEKLLEQTGDGEPLRKLDPKRFEKISNIIKTYKQSCSKLQAQLQTLTLHGPSCSAYIDTLTNNTFVMVVMPPGESETQGNTIVANIKGAKEWFEKVEQ